MRRLRLLLFSILTICGTTIALAQNNDDIELTDSTSTDWGGGVGGGGVTPGTPSDPVTSIAISHSSITLEGGETFRLGANVNATAQNKRIAWTSVNKNIAFVESDGSVTGIGKGTTTITATAVGNSNISATCTVTVINDYIPPTSGYILPWGRDEAWTMKYRKYNLADYVEPSNDATGRNWKELNYADSDWQELTGPMGNEEVWYAPYNYLWTGYDNCFCLRKTFYLPSAPKQSVYRFKAIHDDDLQVYLNGELVATFDGWSNEQEVEAIIPSDRFVKGANQLSLFIQQGGGGAYLDYALYQEANNNYCLTYKVDGEDYQTQTYEYGATIIPLPAPVKEGYTFSGWSEIPETMPAKDIEIRGTFIEPQYTLGDVNNDGKINVFDIASVRMYILKRNPSNFIFEAADMDCNSKINVFDIANIRKLILNK